MEIRYQSLTCRSVKLDITMLYMLRCVPLPCFCRIPLFGEFTCQNAVMAERFIEAGSAYVSKISFCTARNYFMRDLDCPMTIFFLDQCLFLLILYCPFSHFTIKEDNVLLFYFTFLVKLNMNFLTSTNQFYSS